MICMGTGIRARAAQARKKMILDAALDLFLEKGFGAARLEHDCDQLPRPVMAVFNVGTAWKSRVRGGSGRSCDTFRRAESASTLRH